MKSFIIIAVLAALTVSDAASIAGEVTQYKEICVFQENGQENIKVISQDDDTEWWMFGDLFLDEFVNKEAVPGISVTSQITYVGNSTAIVTGVSVNTPPSIPRVEGLGTNRVTVALVSHPGYGISARVRLYGYYDNSV